MLNPNDYKLVPLKELSPELQKSYLDFLERVFEDYSRRAAPIYVHRNVFGALTISEIREDFQRYLSHVHVEGWRINTEICAFVEKESEQVLGELGVCSRYSWGATYLTGYDVIHPDFRKRGLGYLLAGEGMKRAKEGNPDATKVVLEWDRRNIGTEKRIERLRFAGLILSWRQGLMNPNRLEAQIDWRHAPEIYLKAMLTPPANDSNPAPSGMHP